MAEKKLAIAAPLSTQGLLTPELESAGFVISRRWSTHAMAVSGSAQLKVGDVDHVVVADYGRSFTTNTAEAVRKNVRDREDLRPAPSYHRLTQKDEANLGLFIERLKEVS